MTSPATPLLHPSPHEPSAALDRLVARAENLYSLPAVAMKVLELTNQREVDARALKACIENDPALTGKLLRVVNSSLFGLTRQVSDLNQAIGLLGVKPLKLLVLGFSLPSGLFAGVTAEVLGRYWRHALTKAVAARELSESVWRTPGDDAFIAALLQDVGQLLLVQQLGEPYVRFLDKVVARKQELAAMERAAMGFDHTMLSARLLHAWGLPEPIVAAAAYRPDAPQAAASGGSLAQIVYLAELVARLLVDGQSHVLGEILDRGRRERDVRREQLEALVGRLQEKVDQLAGVLRLQLSDGLDYHEVLAAAHGQLSAVAAEAAEELLHVHSREDLGEDDPLLSDVAAIADTVARWTARGREASAEPRPVEGKALKAVDDPPAAMSAAAAVVAPPVEQAGMEQQLAAAVAACRRNRWPLSLMLVELDRREVLNLIHSPGEMCSLDWLVETLCRNVDHPCKFDLRYGTHGFAMILPHCERRAAVELGNRLVDQFRGQAPTDQHGRPAASLSVGIATVSLPPRNFPPGDLRTSAERCLYGSHASGGGVVKSIEIY